ncbi:MAG: hypothetical protein ABIF08_00635 [Nanoarchaeota archaeon]
MRKIGCLLMLCVCLSGCFSRPFVPIYLTNRDEVLIIPRGETFNAIGDDDKLSKHTALDDLVVLYKGKLLELEKEADMKVLNIKKSGNTKAVASVVGTSIAAIIVGIFMKKKGETNAS